MRTSLSPSRCDGYLNGFGGSSDQGLLDGRSGPDDGFDRRGGNDWVWLCLSLSSKGNDGRRSGLSVEGGVATRGTWTW